MVILKRTLRILNMKIKACNNSGKLYSSKNLTEEAFAKADIIEGFNCAKDIIEDVMSENFELKETRKELSKMPFEKIRTFIISDEQGFNEKISGETLEEAVKKLNKEMFTFAFGSLHKEGKKLSIREVF